jgi:hypothetical protein
MFGRPNGPFFYWRALMVFSPLTYGYVLSKPASIAGFQRFSRKKFVDKKSIRV